MKGNNTMELNSGTMAEIVQHYFDTVLFAAGKAPKVSSVSSSLSGSVRTFEVKVCDNPASEAPTKT